MRDASCVFAVSAIENGLVTGGTGWAVQMAIDLKKSVFVFDQDAQTWFEWNGLWKRLRAPHRPIGVYAGSARENSMMPVTGRLWGFMMRIDTDIDIDFADRMLALDGLTHVAASMDGHTGQRQRHPSGVYFQNVPVDPFTGLCSFDYESAADLGYVKIDFLNNSIYEGVRDMNHLDELMADPVWEMLEHKDIVDNLAHIKGHFGIVCQIRPQSVEDLAVVLALMRPGKKHLIGRPRDEIDAQIWKKDGDGYAFKRSHAIAYALSIVVQMNLIGETLLSE